MNCIGHPNKVCLGSRTHWSLGHRSSPLTIQCSYISFHIPLSYLPDGIMYEVMSVQVSNFHNGSLYIICGIMGRRHNFYQISDSVESVLNQHRIGIQCSYVTRIRTCAARVAHIQNEKGYVHSPFCPKRLSLHMHSRYKTSNVGTPKLQVSLPSPNGEHASISSLIRHWGVLQSYLPLCN